MKKLLMVLMACFMTIALVGCQNDKKNDSAYPKNFEEWKTADLMKYLEDKGVFTNKDYEFIQTKDTSDNPVPEEMTELGSYMDEEGLINIFIYYFDPKTDSDKVKAGFEEAKKSKVVNVAADGQKVPLPVTQVIGQFAFDDSANSDPEIKEKFNKALDDLCQEMNVKKEF